MRLECEEAVAVVWRTLSTYSCSIYIYIRIIRLHSAQLYVDDARRPGYLAAYILIVH